MFYGQTNLFPFKILDLNAQKMWTLYVAESHVYIDSGKCSKNFRFLQLERKKDRNSFGLIHKTLTAIVGIILCRM